MVVKRKNKTSNPMGAAQIVEGLLLLIVLFLGIRTLVSIRREAESLPYPTERVAQSSNNEKNVPDSTAPLQIAQVQDPIMIEEVSINIQQEEPEEESTENEKEENEQKDSSSLQSQVSTTSPQSQTPSSSSNSETKKPTTTVKTTTSVKAPNSTPKTSTLNGAGGYGSVSVKNRTLQTKLPVLPYKVNKECTVVINISINRHGNVNWANVASGGTTNNKILCNAALEAAKKIKFNPVKKPDYQAATVYYRFKLKAPKQ